MVDHKHILVVDDEPQITRVLRTTLSSHGYDIRVANDGETALEIMKDWSPDMVITDLAIMGYHGQTRRMDAASRCVGDEVAEQSAQGHQIPQGIVAQRPFGAGGDSGGARVGGFSHGGQVGDSGRL